MPPLVALLVALVVLALPDAAAAEGAWRRPLVAGEVVGSFSYDREAPYAGGRRRGIDLRGAPGAPVLAACRGVVLHAGRVPRFGLGVSLRCGRLVATELGLRAVTVPPGRSVPAGAMVGRLGDGLLRLGARVATDRHGYVDPAVLLRQDSPVAPGAPPAVRRPVPPAIRRRPPRAPAPGGVAVPVLAWAGLGLAAAGLGGGSAVRARRRRRVVPGTALAPR